MKTAAAALMLSLALAAPAAAQSYVYSGTMDDGSQVGFVDRDSLQRAGTTVTAWNLWVYNPAQELAPGIVLSYALRQNTYDCSRRSTVQRFVILYSESGEPIHSGAPDDTGSVPWIPGSMGEAIGNLVCGPTPPAGSGVSLSRALARARTPR